MKTYDLVLFDLDGTLVDSAPGIIHSVAYALKKMGVTEDPSLDLLCFVGPPLAESFQKFFGFSGVQAIEAIAYYREYYTACGMWESTLYPGIIELLIALKQAGLTCCLATSKPEKFAKQILAHYGLDPYFDLIGGASMDQSRSKKGDVIAYVLSSFPERKKDRTLMIGDRNQDIFGAKQMGIDSIGVLYGYGTETELTSAGATYLAPTPHNIKELLCSEIFRNESK